MAPKARDKKGDGEQQTIRIAIVNEDKCKPKKCRQECKKSCPVVKIGKLCIEVNPNSRIAWISEELCIGCGICVKKCPFDAIMIINLPKDLESCTTHRYGPNSFKLHRLPMPRPGQVLGLVGTNGIGKSTALKVLAGKLKPNLGRFDDPPDWQEILTYFRGSELQNYFTRVLEDNLKVIRSLLGINKFVIAVEHDLSVLDYLSDYICCLYGKAGAYGVVTLPFGVREGINIFLAGFVPTENLRFRDESLTFKVSEQIVGDEVLKKFSRFYYPSMSKTQGNFKLTIEGGDFTDSEIVVMLGENGTGKTTFIRMLAGMTPPDEGSNEDGEEMPNFHVRCVCVWVCAHVQFNADVMKPLNIEALMDQEVQNLSGGELQRVAITLCLGQPADIYLIDEPSAYLDSEQRIMASKVLKRFIMHSKKTAFVVEHDFIMATYLADKVVVYEGQASVHATARSPQGLQTGMNLFLHNLDITFRRDPSNYRPRINKWGSTKDREQKEAGTHYYIGDD
ncbi:P-loop containing nucleoside triphosphate hydrolase protein [Dunaliella salina]|uniref:P-loop containing nucleoside triphosphate hydrolase protein n=1 Tax=Dunaliella salina TaxID=3046 RepID=A0ABQ7GUJ7_DUNSA|nr:P-loop containing nucleoside triphosphate hydrolase protein [Dunaliella salina]|eukprot:KAF5838284.1 P-loop containing nucleoside triphosphate hydrolase protein [Dunaliella salina]